jgi:hypothetical protein
MVAAELSDVVDDKGDLLNTCTFSKILTYPDHHLLLFLLFMSHEHDFGVVLFMQTLHKICIEMYYFIIASLKYDIFGRFYSCEFKIHIHIWDHIYGKV